MVFTTWTAREAARRVAAREVSVVELTAAALAHLQQREAAVQAFSYLNEQALAQAVVLDQWLAAQPKDVVLPRLFGVPFGLKDNMAVAGFATACACRLLLNNQAAQDSAVAAILRQQGVLLGKLNMDELAMGSSTATSCHHPTYNPLDLSRSPGGSSGGPAAAVQAGEVFYSLGSDTGGSIRQPAAFCGVVGLKPTWGLVDTTGVVPMAPSLDVVGPLTKDVADSAAVLSVLTGRDYETGLEQGVKGLRVGLPQEYWQAGLAENMLAQIQQAADSLTAGGCQVQPVSLPTSQHGLRAYHVIAPAELAQALASLGQGLSPAERSALLGAEAKRRLLTGTFYQQTEAGKAYYQKACQVRTLIQQEFCQIFQQVDLLLAPCVRQTAFLLDAAPEDPVEMYQNDLLLAPVNLSGICALSLPYGQVGALPGAVQLIAGPNQEALLFRVAKYLESC